LQNSLISSSELSCLVINASRLSINCPSVYMLTFYSSQEPNLSKVMAGTCNLKIQFCTNKQRVGSNRNQKGDRIVKKF